MHDGSGDLERDTADGAMAHSAHLRGASGNGETGASVTAWKLYLWLVLPATILLNLSFPNFHAPDDYDHLKRAYTLFHHPFQLVTPERRSTGAMIDSGLISYIDNQIPIVKFKQPLNEQDRLAYARNDRTRWTGRPAFSEMPGALNYFPLLYAPQAVMLEIGRMSGSTVEHSVLWARFANAFVGIVLAALGLYLLPSGGALALLLLLLPRTLLQFASNSADPILYGLALIIVALPLRFRAPGRLKSSLLAAAVFTSATVRLPVAALALTAGVRALRQRRWLNLALLAIAGAAALVWVLTILPTVTDRRCGVVGSVRPKLTAFALEWPLLIGRTMVDHASYFYAGFVGNYAWGNAPIAYLGIAMPTWIYVTALPLLAFALWQDLATPAPLSAWLRTSLLVGAACSIVLTFLAMYVGCTVASETIIRGVQGRYFVTPLFAIAAAVGGLAAGRVRSSANGYSKLLIVWVIACTATMLMNSAQIYGNLG